MFVRLAMVTGSAADVQDTARFIETFVRPKAEAAQGNRGFTTATAAAYGSTLDASYWVDVEAMTAAGESLSATRAEFAEANGGMVRSEDFQVMLGFQRAESGAGALLELSRFECRPELIERMVGVVETDMLSEIRAAIGLCGAQLLYDAEGGRGILATRWESDDSARAFWLTSGQLRARAARQVEGLTFIGVDFYSVVSARSLQT